MANEQNNILFVQEVEKNACLYNYNNLPEYSRKDIIEKAWCKVGEKFNLTGPESKEKWRNIRSVFVRNLKPAKSGSSAKKKRPYYLENVMQFALPYIKLNESSISGSLPISQVSHENTHEELNFSEFETAVEDTLPVIESESILSMPSPSTTEHTLLYTPSPEQRPSSSASTCSNPPKPRPKKERQSDVDKNIIEYLASKKPRNVELESNPRIMFLLSLLPDIEPMTDVQMRCFKRRVMEVIEEILTNIPPVVAEPNSQITLYYETMADAMTNAQNSDTNNLT